MSYKKIWPISIGFTSLALCFSTSALAQEDEAKKENTPHVIDLSNSAESSRVRNMDAISITATRQEQNILDVPATVSVITREQMDERNVENIKDLVRYQPGIQVTKQTSGTDPFGNLSGFVVRGVGENRVQIQVDGSRVIERSQDGNRDFVDLSMMKAVEIMRGPGSVLWGADALGGIVAYRTLDPEDLLKGNNVGGRVSTGFDSLNQGYTQTGMVGVQLSPTMQGLIGYTYRTYSEARLSNARADGGQWGCTRVAIGCDRLNPLNGESHNALAKLVWKPNANHEIKFTGEAYESDADVLQLYDKYITTGTTKNSGDYLRNQTQTRKRIAFEHDWKVDETWLDNLKWKVSYSPQKRALDDVRYQTISAADTVTYQKTDYTEDFLQADIQLTSSFDLGKTKHQLTYGFQGDTTDTDYFRKTTVNNRSAGTWTTTYGSGSNFSSAKTTRSDFFLQDEIKLFNNYVTLTPGVRWANYKIDPKPDSNYSIIPGKEPQKLDSSRLIPQFGMLFKLNDQYSLYGRYAEGFKMPTTQQLFTSFSSATSNIVPNPDLKPEEVISYEAGVRGQFDKGWFSLGVFYADYTNFIKSMQFVEGTAMDYTSLNVSKVKLWGIEASGEWRFARNWKVNAGASYQYGKERDDASNPYVPFSGASPLNAVLGLKWEKPDWKLNTELVGTFSKGITRTNKETYYKPAGYAVYDGYLNWQIDKTFRFTVSLLNILDKRYFNTNAATKTSLPGTAANVRTDPLELYTAPGRTFGVSLSADF